MLLAGTGLIAAGKVSHQFSFFRLGITDNYDPGAVIQARVVRSTSSRPASRPGVAMAGIQASKIASPRITGIFREESLHIGHLWQVPFVVEIPEMLPLNLP